MKHLLLIAVLASVLASALAMSGRGGREVSAHASVQAPSSSAGTSSQAIPPLQENARQARVLLGQAIQALGGQAFLNMRSMQQEGRAYTLFHGRSTSNGVLFWRFVEYPDRERIEVTKERDVAYVYSGNKGYEITYKGPHSMEKKDLDDYLRRRRLSLETVLRTWVDDPGVALFYEGNALAGNLPAQQVTLINAKNEAISLYFDPDTHLPIKKSYKWRDPVDRDINVEEEIYDNYRPVEGVMTPYNFTRYYNGDMQSERFVNSVHFNPEFDETMFDPNSGYNPNKPAKKH
jgi:hypothetical protein